MKVYVAICCYAYKEFIIGIYSTEAKAEEAIQHDKRRKRADWYDIDEYIIDDNSKTIAR